MERNIFLELQHIIIFIVLHLVLLYMLQILVSKHDVSIRFRITNTYTLSWNYNSSNNSIRTRFEIQSSINNLFTNPTLIYITNYN
jgi:hypothetical protein